MVDEVTEKVCLLSLATEIAVVGTPFAVCMAGFIVSVIGIIIDRSRHLFYVGAATLFLLLSRL